MEKQPLEKDNQNIINERSYDVDVLEGQQAYSMSLLTSNGILRGSLIICRYMATFEPNMRDFARLLCDRQKDPDVSKQKHNKINQLDSVHDYQVTIDFNDIVMTDIETRPYNQDSQPQIESILSIFLDHSLDHSEQIEGGHKCYLKVDFIALEPAKEAGGGTGRTSINYILEKIQYLTGKVKTSQESILKFTEEYVPPPTQSQVKQFSLVRCDSLVQMSLTSNNSFSQLANNPPKLDYYPVMRELASDNASYQQGVTLIVASKKQKPSFVSPKQPLLSQSLFEQIVERLPCYLQNKDWTLLFNPLRHGFSFDQFLKKTSNIGPHVLVIRDRKNQNIFGAFVTEGWQKRDNTYGTGEAFLFSFKRNPDYYPRKYAGIMSYNVHGGESQHVQLCNETGFAVGVDAQYALFVHYTFDKGSTHPTRIMNNNPLTYPCDFKIDTFEIWGLDDSVL